VTLHTGWAKKVNPNALHITSSNIGRRAATRLRCGGIVNDRCIANFLETQIVAVKEF